MENKIFPGQRRSLTKQTPKTGIFILFASQGAERHPSDVPLGNWYH